jgi:hypothetical protein
MAVRIVSQQRGDPRWPPALHVWPLLHATALLDSGGKKKISKGTNRTPEDSDIKPAYRRCHLNAITAMQTITQLPDNKLGIIMLHLTFGGAPCPFEWNISSESICDLANKILFDENWDPLTNYAPSQHLVPAMDLLDTSIPFAEGADLIVDIPVDPRGTGDGSLCTILPLTPARSGPNHS